MTSPVTVWVRLDGTDGDPGVPPVDPVLVIRDRRAAVVFRSLPGQRHLLIAAIRQEIRGRVRHRLAWAAAPSSTEATASSTGAATTTTAAASSGAPGTAGTAAATIAIPVAAGTSEDPRAGLLDREDVVAGDLELDLHRERFAGFRLVQFLEVVMNHFEVIAQLSQFGLFAGGGEILR